MRKTGGTTVLAHGKKSLGYKSSNFGVREGPRTVLEANTSSVLDPESIEQNELFQSLGGGRHNKHKQ